MYPVYVLKPLLTLILLFSALDANAQVNTEKYRDESSNTGVSADIELSGEFKTGNTDELVIEMYGQVSWQMQKTEILVIFDNEYEWIDGLREINEQLIHLRTIYSLGGGWSTEIFTQVNLDQKIKILNRELVGSGLRYSYDLNKRSKVNFGSGYMFEHENYDLPSNAIHPDQVQVSRWTNYISVFHKIRPDISYAGVVYAQPMFTDFGDYRLLHESTLKTAVSDWLELVLSFKYRFDSKPADEVKQTDTETNMGIAISF
jgi:hypothetical protein